ncbi:hypothetical protein CAPTEDRAFT_104679 [Capitella teleta]|uniref:Cytochrome P450 n=1 Tax=Capitella teleta TaxID=283909 RepID=R7VGC8_CAPTE|nr:hypothetical protein CAPTEDRAFT_104679 [Capitella teleta]|eukprot:ELU17903.1 hypothetical protein CAPTEDRAFT_104679 [Capitella teleta]
MSVLCTVGVLTLFAIWNWKRSGKNDKLPHYRGWPVVGNLFQVRMDKPELTFIEWAKDLGPVFSVKMLNQQFVVLSSFDAIYEALVTKGNQFTGRPSKNAFRVDLVTDNFLNIANLQTTSLWKKLRMICQKKIKMYGTGMKRIGDISSEMIENLLEEFKGTGQKSFNPRDIIYNTITNTIMTLALGKTFSTDDEIYKKMVQFEEDTREVISFVGRGVELDVCPWLRYFGNETYKRILSIIELRNHLWVLMKEESSRGDQLLGEDEDDVRLVSALKDAQAEEGSGISEKHLRAVVMFDIAFAGTSTTSNNLYIYLNTISKNPRVQEKLQEEVDNVVGSERMVSLDDKEKMPYTQATMLELLRYASVVPLGVPRTSNEDTIIQGHNIPAGSTVLMNLYHLHHDEEFWMNPYEFQPERFLNDDGGLVSASHPNRRHLMPFGAGLRVCLGEILAKSRLFLVIASLTQKFDILPGESSAPCDPRLLEHGVILTSAKYEIVARERF